MSQQSASTKVIVGMSGGVDSSVSALLLLQAGYTVEGLFMKNWDEDDGTEYCTARQDLADATQVCDRLGIPLHTANFAAEYWDNVFEHFLQEYKSGRTPNPDILCNREIKFKVFLEYARILGGHYIATGHYARTRSEDGRTLLLKATDTDKDQTYFLHAVGAAEFAQTLFPVGDLTKPEVRRIAQEHELITHSKKDSTGICFIGERRFRDFLEQYLPARPGLIKTTDGITLGEHRGLMYHTIGQRQGLGIGGVAGFNEEPWYVADKDLTNNEMIVVQGTDHPLLFKQLIIAGNPHWINGPPTESDRLTARIRHRQADQECELDGINDNRLSIYFKVPQRAVTPGQSIVFYSGDYCLGGAVIESAANP